MAIRDGMPLITVKERDRFQQGAALFLNKLLDLIIADGLRQHDGQVPIG